MSEFPREYLGTIDSWGSPVDLPKHPSIDFKGPLYLSSVHTWTVYIEDPIGMKLPHAGKAVVPKEKLTNYLLSATHPLGHDKAAFFNRFGFRIEEWDVMAHSLREHIVDHDVASTQDTRLGTRYTVEGQLETPDGRRPLVRVVWFIARNANIPRFVTAYPLERSKR